jgi:peptidoglycan/xylan/chitin deacetylase (PgdA/CDA1 family)
MQLRLAGKRKIHVLSAITVFLGLLALGSCLSAQPQTRTVAITFDDLPMANLGREQDPLAAATSANRQIIASLRRYRAPASGFVNEAIVQSLGPGSQRLLNDWNRGRNELANHGHSHLDANDIDLASLEREVVQGETTIGPMARSNVARVSAGRFDN